MKELKFHNSEIELIKSAINTEKALNSIDSDKYDKVLKKLAKALDLPHVGRSSRDDSLIEPVARAFVDQFKTENHNHPIMKKVECLLIGSFKHGAKWARDFYEG